jgi:hypothetical protein
MAPSDPNKAKQLTGKSSTALMSSSVKLQFLGKEYKVDDLLPECVGLTKELAVNARLDQPLPANTDLTDEEFVKVQQQVCSCHLRVNWTLSLSRRKIPAMLILPDQIVIAFWSMFAAHHLPSLATALRTRSPSTQKKAVSVLIQILSLLPDPMIEPYFRKFLSNSEQSRGLPTLISDAFVKGIEWKRPSGPGHICKLIVHTLYWCDPAMGDDSKASIDSAVRLSLVDKLEQVAAHPQIAHLEEAQHVQMVRLKDLLNAINSAPDAKFLNSIRDDLKDQVAACRNPNCTERAPAPLTCARCRCVRYCGKACQVRDWKNGHKLVCFETAY